jgi:hypothetical protein
MIKLVSFQGCKDDSMHTNNKCSTAHKQNSMIISLDAKKSFGKTQHLFLIKSLKKLGTDGR